MELTRHATIRGQQRVFQSDDIALIVIFGTPIKRPGNASQYIITKKDKTRLIQSLDRIQNKAVLVNNETDMILTAYNIDKKHKGGAL